MNGSRPGGPPPAGGAQFGAPADYLDEPAPYGEHPAPYGEHNAFAPAVPTSGPPGRPGSPAPAGLQWGPEPESDQGRFDAFKPDEAPKVEPPAPKVRNGRVLLAVLVAAVLLLGVPLGALWLIGKSGDSADPSSFNPEVGACVKQSGDKPVMADCGDEGAFQVVSKVPDKAQCTDVTQPHIVAPLGDGKEQVLCLQKKTAQ